MVRCAGFVCLYFDFFGRFRFSLSKRLDRLFAPEKLEEKNACKFSTLKFSEGCLDRL